ncbi:CAP domain-containing protein [Sphingomonas sp. RS2018]
MALAALALGGSAPGFPDSDAIVAEINLARNNPRAYADVLRDYRRGFERDGISHRALPTARPTPTLEGVAAVDEAIGVLMAMKPAPSLAAASLLTDTAEELGASHARTGQIGHTSPDGLMPAQRVERRGGQPYGIAEAISYGQTTARDVVRQLIVDGGVPSRMHRRLILDPYFRVAGAWCGPHRRYGAVCVVDLGVRPRGGT